MNALRNIPLQDVMALNGHKPVRRFDNSLYYRCPNPSHKDEDPSFRIEITPTDKSAGARFNCFGCKQLHGAGAIELQAQLWGVTPRGKDFWRIIDRLSHEFHIEVQGITDSHDHYVTVDPVSEFEWERTEWTDNHLRALGCKVEPQYSEADRGEAEEATGKMVYSWGMVGEPRQRKPYDFDPEDITRRFGVEPVAWFKTPAKKEYSHMVRATDYYPMFVIKTVDGEGRWRVKKYEPYNRPDKNGVSYKWTWWYQGNDKGRNAEYKHMLYGDSDVLDALYNLDVVPADTSVNRDHPVVQDQHYREDGQVENTVKFRRVCICSGPRDAIQVFYHSDCHVVYPHSETAEIAPSLIKRLFKIAEEVFILFDKDKTGIREATQLNLEYLMLRNVELPDDLSMLTDTRTGKPAKDASGYFELYGMRLSSSRYGRKGIDAHFDDLLSRSIPLQFWHRERKVSNAEKPLGKCHYNYDLLIDPMKRFLRYSGMAKMKVNEQTFRFVLIENNIVDTIPDKLIVSTARRLMTDWLKEHPYYYNSDLSNRIANASNMINRDNLLDLPTEDLDFKHWGPSWDYDFFENTAVKITPHGRELQDYATLPFYVNRAAIVKRTYEYKPDCLEVSLNPMLEQYERRHRERLDQIAEDDYQAIQDENEEWERTQRLWTYRNTFKRAYGELPHIVQYLYNAGRTYWREEGVEDVRRGKPHVKKLSPERQQFHDMQFVSKVLAIGYLLCRHRSPSMPYMVYATDYRVVDETKATGRTGKSILGKTMGCIRNECGISGKDFKASPEMASRNFRDYDYLRDDYININDLRSSVDTQTFYTWAEGEIVRKNLGKDEVDIPRDMAAKFFISCNKMVDLSAPSTKGRIWLMLFSDYYHEADGRGMQKWNPRMEFGYDLGVEDTPEQMSEMQNFFMYCQQAYLQVRECVMPPADIASQRREMYEYFRHTKGFDIKFIEWADQLFSNKAVFGVPVPKIDLVVSWYQFAGLDVHQDAVVNYAKGQTFGKMLSAYCSHLRITVNPDVVYARPSERNRMPSAKAHVYEFLTSTGRLSGRRVFSDRQSCYFFFNRGEEPSEITQVQLGQNMAEDIFSDGYILES